VNASAGLYVLSEEFGEDNLLGKKLGADGEVGCLILAAAAEEARKEKKDNVEPQKTLSRRRGEVHD
jgi:hypothetical protein